MNNEFIAHVRKKENDEWDAPQLLAEHLKGVAALAEVFAAKFESGEWAKAAGLAHDAGKARVEWQKYLRLKSGFFDETAHLEGKPGKIPHAIHGAKLVEEQFGKEIGRILAYCIAGHHAGLPDWSNGEGAGQASLQFQETQVKGVADIAPFVAAGLKTCKPMAPPRQFSRDGLDMALWIRMLYSALVDADFLDTETYMEPGRVGLRGGYCSIVQLLDRFNEFMNQLDKSSEMTSVNQIRRDIRTKCVRMAGEPQGVFSLSVPTGGGKTLSSLAFGLEHAKVHGLDRIIYVIPYTSIIEQNADVFRAAVGSDQVVEHHSSLVEEDVTAKGRLAAENWDAPIIVTTSVQFFESLFAAKSSRCRKLHNICKSVIVLDEAQLVPADYLTPILEALQLLVDHYQVSLVISTATQPAFDERQTSEKRFAGLRNIREIMGDTGEVKRLYNQLRRVRVELPGDLRTPSDWETIAVELIQYDQVLCIVSDRQSCRALYELMPEGTYHLSALMCGQHRSEMIREIKEKLKANQKVRVISTQLVEAGVDFDFPVVYRALAGLDSIAQAAGRCNREGKLFPALGKVTVFVPPKKAPLGILRKAAETTCGIMARTMDDPLKYELFEEYFSELYWKVNSLDVKEIGQLLRPDQRELGISFRTAADRFRLIDGSAQTAIFVRYGQGEALIDELKAKGPDRQLLRKLQRYVVNVYGPEFNQLLQQGAIEEVYPQIYALTTRFQYSKAIGLLLEAVYYNPDQCIF